MTECRFFGTCKDIQENIEAIKLSDASQDASMKSLHKRLDDDSVLRKDTNKQVTDLHDSLLKHMSWEEAMVANAKDNRGIILWGGAIVISAIVAFTSYMFLKVDSNKNSIIQIQEYRIQQDKHIESIDSNIKDINSFLRGNK